MGSRSAVLPFLYPPKRYKLSPFSSLLAVRSAILSYRHTYRLPPPSTDLRDPVPPVRRYSVFPRPALRRPHSRFRPSLFNGAFSPPPNCCTRLSRRSPAHSTYPTHLAHMALPARLSHLLISCRVVPGPPRPAAVNQPTPPSSGCFCAQSTSNLWYIGQSALSHKSGFLPRCRARRRPFSDTCILTDRSAAFCTHLPSLLLPFSIVL